MKNGDTAISPSLLFSSLLFPYSRHPSLFTFSSFPLFYSALLRINRLKAQVPRSWIQDPGFYWERICLYAFSYVLRILRISCRYVITYSCTNSGDGSWTLGHGMGRPITVMIGTLGDGQTDRQTNGRMDAEMC